MISYVQNHLSGRLDCKYDFQTKICSFEFNYQPKFDFPTMKSYITIILKFQYLFMFMCWCIQEGMHVVYIYFHLLGLESEKQWERGFWGQYFKTIVFFSFWHSLIIFSKENISYNNWLCFSSYRINLQQSSCSHHHLNFKKRSPISDYAVQWFYLLD